MQTFALFSVKSGEKLGRFRLDFGDITFHVLVDIYTAFNTM